MKIKIYLQLMRFHKPVGILLLWFPTAWALWVANQGHPSIRLLTYFFIGTVLMRAAGCVVNDIADRQLDKHVSRTRLRPLTTGAVGLYEACGLLIILLFAAFLILIQLPTVCFYYAVAAVFVTILYPFCKRFLQAPQVVLGVAFSMGIPMAYAASNSPLNNTTWILILLNFLWIVAYDTLYAITDREDDLRIGIKSTAILFAEYDRVIIGLLQISVQSLWGVLAYILHWKPMFYLFWSMGSLLFIYQQYLIKNPESNQSFKAFSSNNWYGLLLWLGIIWSN